MRSALLTLALIAAGCSDTPLFGDPDIRLNSVAVNESDGILLHDNIEVEVHIYDADTRDRLGCARTNIPSRSGTRVTPNKPFNLPDVTTRFLNLADVAGRTIYVVVWEDDFNACPTAPGLGDDYLGQSEPFPASQLAGDVVRSFGKVSHLELGL
jgi:hypothetical protein